MNLLKPLPWEIKNRNRNSPHNTSFNSRKMPYRPFSTIDQKTYSKKNQVDKYIRMSKGIPAQLRVINSNGQKDLKRCYSGR